MRRRLDDALADVAKGSGAPSGDGGATRATPDGDDGWPVHASFDDAGLPDDDGSYGYYGADAMSAPEEEDGGGSSSLSNSNSSCIRSRGGRLALEKERRRAGRYNPGLRDDAQVEAQGGCRQQRQEEDRQRSHVGEALGSSSNS